MEGADGSRDRKKAVNKQGVVSQHLGLMEWGPSCTFRAAPTPCPVPWR